MVRVPAYADGRSEAGHAVPASDSPGELGNRIALVVSWLGGSDLSSVVGKSVKQIQRYAQGKSEPPVTAITALAAAAAVRVEWLATGRGSIREEPAGNPPAAARSATDVRLLGRLTEKMLEIHQEAGRPIGVRQAVELAAREHDRIVCALSDPDDRLVRAGEVIAELRRALSVGPPDPAVSPRPPDE